MTANCAVAAQGTLVFIDGPNIDAVLGTCVLERRPEPRERPRWDRIWEVCRAWFGATKPCFVLNGNHFDTSAVFAFRRTLRTLGYRVECPRNPDEDPVDKYIVDTVRDSLPAIERREIARVVVFSHDHGYAPILAQVLALGGAVTIVGFREELAPALLALESGGAHVLDLEYDLEAFTVRLQRLYARPA